MAKDPVCGMTVNEAKAKAAGLTSHYQGTHYYFCHEGCKRTFDAKPGQYLKDQEPDAPAAVSSASPSTATLATNRNHDQPHH